METIKVKWTGIRPLVMHNGLLADPTNKFTIAIKEITKKGSKKMGDSGTDHAKRDRLEWEGGGYWLPKGGCYQPSDNIERCVQSGASKDRLGKDFAAAVFVADDTVEVQYEGPKNLEEMYADPRFTLRKGVVIQGNRIIRVRPMIPTGWSITFTLEFDEDIVDRKNVIRAMTKAGALCGLGDWRPKFGRFLVEVLD